MRWLLVLALTGCAHFPDRMTVRAPDRTPLAVVDLKRAEVVLTPRGWALFVPPRRRR